MHLQHPPICFYQQSAPVKSTSVLLDYSTDTPSYGEILAVALTISESTGPAKDTIEEWAQSVVALSRDFPSAETWQPGPAYQFSGHSYADPLQQGLDYLILHEPERRRAIHLALAHEGIIVTTHTLTYYLRRLKAPRASKINLTIHSVFRWKYVLTAAAHFLNDGKNLDAVLELLGMAHDATPSGKEASPTKAGYKSMAHAGVSPPPPSSGHGSACTSPCPACSSSRTSRACGA
jgi:hypothetical protein